MERPVSTGFFNTRRLMKFFSTIKDSILDLAFPQVCHVCHGPVEGSFHGVACKECWNRTQFLDNDAPACSKCGALLYFPINSEHCPGCRDHYYDRAGSIGIYENAMSAIVLNLKRLPMIPRIVSERILPTLEQCRLRNFNLIIPVPLSPKRRIERGFNQAEIIAGCVSRLSGTKTDHHSLKRKTHTPVHRAAMDRKARETTVKNAFEVCRPRLIEGKAVLLVDDIFTSGATVSNCANVLKKGGAASVEVFTLARAEIRSRNL
jgi:competence protein ComFC